MRRLRDLPVRRRCRRPARRARRTTWPVAATTPSSHSRCRPAWRTPSSPACSRLHLARGAHVNCLPRYASSGSPPWRRPADMAQRTCRHTNAPVSYADGPISQRTGAAGRHTHRHARLPLSPRGVTPHATPHRRHAVAARRGRHRCYALWLGRERLATTASTSMRTSKNARSTGRRCPAALSAIRCPPARAVMIVPQASCGSIACADIGIIRISHSEPARLVRRLLEAAIGHPPVPHQARKSGPRTAAASSNPRPEWRRPVSGVANAHRSGVRSRQPAHPA